MNERDYWEEAVSIALDEAGISATEDQINSIAADIEVSHQQIGMAFGHSNTPNPVISEAEKLRKQLKKEQSKEICPDCKGKGWDATQGCLRCKGLGFIYNF